MRRHMMMLACATLAVATFGEPAVAKRSTAADYRVNLHAPTGVWSFSMREVRRNKKRAARHHARGRQAQRKPSAITSRPSSPPAPEPAVMTLASLGPVDAPMPTDQRAPMPALPLDLFRRYVRSLEIVVKPWVKIDCPNGSPLPLGLVSMLTEAAKAFGAKVYINSAYRDPEYNRRVGGARFSLHMHCKAVDFRVAGVASDKLRAWVIDNRKRWGINGIGYYGINGHVHADIGTRFAMWTGGSKRLRHARAT